MKGDNIQYASEVFSCEQKDKFAILTLQEQALRIATDLQVREDYFSDRCEKIIFRLWQQLNARPKYWV